VTHRLWYSSATCLEHWAVPVNIKVRFGRAIRRIRDEQDISQEEAAERCTLHRTYYSGVERGVRNVSLVNIERIARGLKTSLPDLFKSV
jgi:transcriptional regulator with XRE-family HTH domain